MTDRTPVVLVDDDEIVRSWVRQALAGSSFEVVAEAPRAGEALAAAARNAAVLLVDYKLPGGLGTDLLRELRKAGVTAPALLMTANPEAGFNRLVQDAGGQGTLLKTGSREALLEALHAVVGGHTAFDLRHPPREEGTSPLTPREREVLRLVADGATNRQVAVQLGISSESVKTLLGRTFSKLGVSRRAEAVAAAHRAGLL